MERDPKENTFYYERGTLKLPVLSFFYDEWERKEAFFQTDLWCALTKVYNTAPEEFEIVYEKREPSVAKNSLPSNFDQIASSNIL